MLKEIFSKNKNFLKKLIFTLGFYFLITLKTFTCYYKIEDKMENIKEDEVLKIDAIKLKRIERKIDQFYILFYFPNNEYLLRLKEYTEEAVHARLNDKMIRFFKMNYLDNRDIVRKLNIKNLPALVLFDRTIPEKKILIDQRLEYKNMVRFSEKANGSFQPVMINDRSQVNDSYKKNKKMLILLNPKISQFKQNGDYDHLLEIFMRYSVIAGYDYFHLCDENFFFDELVTPKDKNAKFSEDTFHFLAGFIKNDTTKILFDEPKIDTENPDIFTREFNHFSLNIKEFMEEEKKEQKFLDIILFKKSNIYSSLGESDLNTLVTHGKPTVIIVCDKITLNKDREFHKNMYNFAKKYDNDIKFYFSTNENLTILNLLKVFNFDAEPPFVFLIEKSDTQIKHYNKFVKTNLNLEVEEIEKFVNDYKEKKLPLYFVSDVIPTKNTEKTEIISQNVTDMNELNETRKFVEKIYSNLTKEKTNMTVEELEYFQKQKMKNKTENYTKYETENKREEEIIPNNFTDVELNKKYYNKGENIYKIVGKNFAEFLYDTRDKVVAVFGRSSPMYYCDLTLKRLKLISRIFSKHLNKIIFCMTDPNKNEYIVKKPNTRKDLERPEDYQHYIFDIIYPAFITFDAIESDGERNEILIKKLNSVKNFEKEFYSDNIIEFLLMRLNMTEKEADLEMDYLKQKDFSREPGYTDDYDFDDERIEKIKYQMKIDNLIESLKNLVDVDEESLKLLFQQDPSQVKKFSDMVYGEFDPEKYDPSNPNKSAQDAIAEKEKQEL